MATERIDMLAQAGAFGDQLRSAVPRGLVAGRGRISNVLLAGLGGSAAGARLAVALLEPRLRVPATVVSAPELPAWVGPETLVIVTSYSGGTLEALDWWRRAGERGAVRVAITAGGALAEEAEEAGEPLIRVADGFQPRGALGLLLAPILVLLEEAGAAPGASELLEACAEAADRVRDACGAGSDGGAAAEAAASLVGRAVVLYGAGPLAAVAIRLKNQLNENAKVAAFAGAVPEMAHNEVLGWTGAAASGLPLAAVMLRDPDEDPATRAVADAVAEELREEGHPVLEWTGEGETPIERAFWLLAFGDHVSCRLADLLGVDVGDIARLTRLKHRLRAALQA